jgi:hypothetical protein
MGRVLISLAAVVSVAVLLAVALAPEGPELAPLTTPEPEAEPTPAPPMLKVRAPATSAAPATEPVSSEEVEEVEEVEVDPKDAPPDPIQRGDCTLVLELTGEASEQPLDTTLELWRINEPGNEHWTAGDRRIATPKTEDGQVEITDLAAGRYRIHAYGQRKGSRDPVAFDVAGVRTVVALALPAPRRFQVRLRVYDQAGRFVLRGKKQSGGASSYSRSGDRKPDWVKSRRLHEGFLNGSISIGGGCGSGGGRGALVPVEALDGAFDMLTMRESERRRSWSRTWYLHPEEGSTVSLYARSDTARDRTFVGVTLPRAELHDAIRLPDGSRAIDAGARIKASCSAVLVQADGLEPDWRSLPIEVRVHLKGYADLAFKHTLAQPLEDRTLVPHVE